MEEKDFEVEEVGKDIQEEDVEVDEEDKEYYEIFMAEDNVKSEEDSVGDKSSIEPPTQTNRSKRKTLYMILCIEVIFIVFLGCLIRDDIKKHTYERKQEQASVLIHRGGVLSVEQLQVIGGIGKVEDITKGKVTEECRWVISSKLTLDDNVTVHTVIPMRITIEPITWSELFIGKKIRYLVKLLPGTCVPKEPMPEIEISGDLEIGKQFHYPVDPKEGFFLILTETNNKKFELFSKYSEEKGKGYQLFVESRP